MTAISPSSNLFAASIARAWLRLYTFGLPEETRSRRAVELESDLWEHESDAAYLRVAPAIAGAEIFGRLVRGMPADLLWRLQLDGPQMQLHIPYERILGGMMVSLVVLLIVINE